MWKAHLLPGERQRAVPEWPGYFVTSLGRVFSFKRQGYQCSVIHLNMEPREMVPVESRQGSTKRLTMVVTLKEGRSRTKTWKVAVLVARAFLGPPKPGRWVLHRDDDPRNNRLSNLRYGTPKENHEDAFRNGGRVKKRVLYPKRRPGRPKKVT